MIGRKNPTRDVVSACFCIMLASMILGICNDVHAWQGGYDENTEIAIKGKILQILNQPYKGFHVSCCRQRPGDT